MIELATFPYLNTVSSLNGTADWSRTLDGFSQAKIKMSNCDDICDYLGCWKSVLRFSEQSDASRTYVWSGVVTQVVSSETGVEITASDFSVLISRLAKKVSGLFTPLQAWEKLAKLVYDQFHIQLDVTGVDSPFLLEFDNYTGSSVLEEISKVTDWTVVDTTVFVGGQSRGSFDLDFLSGGYATQCKASDIYTRVTVSNGVTSVTKINTALEQELGFQVPKTIDSTLATKTSLERYAEKWLLQAGTSLKLVTNGELDLCTDFNVFNLIPGDTYKMFYRSFCDNAEATFRINKVFWDDNMIKIDFDQNDENEDDSGAF